MMEYTLESLMAQLGIEDNDGFKALIQGHTPLAADTLIADAKFWNPSQAAFLKESIASDGPWSLAVGQLDSLTRID